MTMIEGNKCSPLFALVDCNNFYASCERVFNPKLKNAPIIVLSNNDGCVIARSNEAKALGIAMGEPFFKCRPIVKKHSVQVFSSNFALYGDMSRRVMTVLEQFSPMIENYSIDEAFLRLDGVTKVSQEYAQGIRATVHQWTGIPVSIGIAPTKTLAKAANRIAKKNPEFTGVMDFSNRSDVDSFLRSILVEDVWGVGRQYAQLLNSRGIKTALQLKEADTKWIKKHMTVVGLKTVTELRGVPCIPLENAPPPKQSIICSRSFGTKVTRKENLQEAIASFAARAAEKLRKQKSVAGRIDIFIRTSPFMGNYYSDGAGTTLPHTADTRFFITAAKVLLDRLYKPGFDYKKAGIVLLDIRPENHAQGELFDPSHLRENLAVMKAMDRINSEWGSGTVTLAAEGLRKSWKMRQENISKRYTTRWGELACAVA